MKRRRLATWLRGLARLRQRVAGLGRCVVAARHRLRRAYLGALTTRPWCRRDIVRPPIGPEREPKAWRSVVRPPRGYASRPSDDDLAGPTIERNGWRLSFLAPESLEVDPAKNPPRSAEEWLAAASAAGTAPRPVFPAVAYLAATEVLARDAAAWVQYLEGDGELARAMAAELVGEEVAVARPAADVVVGAERRSPWEGGPSVQGVPRSLYPSGETPQASPWLSPARAERIRRRSAKPGRPSSSIRISSDEELPSADRRARAGDEDEIRDEHRASGT